jgi:hypothetical protein
MVVRYEPPQTVNHFSIAATIRSIRSTFRGSVAHSKSAVRRDSRYRRWRRPSRFK